MVRRPVANKNKVALYYEAAVAGGIPILRTLVNSLASDKITRLLGVVNGTSNFMLTKNARRRLGLMTALSERNNLDLQSDPN